MERQTSILSGKLGSVIIAGMLAFSWSTAKAQNLAPYFDNPTPANNTTINATVGTGVSFQVRGKDSQPQMVTLSSTALPAGATMSPALPTSAVMVNNGSKVNSHFSWVPTTADVGMHTIVYTLTDNAAVPLTTTRTINILVAPLPCSLAVQTLAQNVSCFGANNGSIVTTVSGPFTAPLSYTWSNNATTQNLGNLAPGTYTVSVMDANGCTGTAVATIVQPAPLTASATATNLACNAASNGAITLNVSGGTGPYAFNWSNNATTQNQSGLLPGLYTVTVTDANLCTTTASVTVGQPMASSIAVTGVATNISCNNTSNGIIDITASGGTPPYTYLWNNTATTEDLSGLLPGTYTVTVTDAFMCTGTSSFTVNPAIPGVILNSVSVNPVTTVPGQLPNTIYLGYGTQTVNLVTSLNGTPGLTYTWTTTTNNTIIGTSGSLNVSPLATTSYIVTTMDNVGCLDIDTVTVHVMDVRCGNNNDKVMVCHKVNGSAKGVLCISPSAVPSHLAHGDVLGSCTPDPVFGNAPNAKLGENAETHSALTAYPNPTSGFINLVLPAYSGGASLAVIDISGKVIKTISVSPEAKEMKLDLSTEAKGIYFVELITDRETFRTKVMLQ
jgi:hypothetical protein